MAPSQDGTAPEDAVHINRNHADYVHDHGGHYLLTVKNNQPTLLRRLACCPGPRSGRPPGNAAAVMVGSRPARSAWSASTLAQTRADRSSRMLPRRSSCRRRRALASTRWTTVTVYAIASLTAS